MTEPECRDSLLAFGATVIEYIDCDRKEIYQKGTVSARGLRRSMSERQ